MFKKQISILFVIILVFWGLGLNGYAQEKYYSKEKGFSIKLPKDWEKRENFMGLIIIALSPQEGNSDQFRENVNVAVDEFADVMPLEKYFQTSLDSMQKLLTQFQEHENGQVIIDNKKAKWITYSHRVGVLRLKVLAYLLISGNRGYVITCSATPEQFSKYNGRFKEIAQSLKLD